MQHTTVALRERGRLAALFRTLWHAAGQQPGWREPDRRNTRTWQALLLAVLVARTTRLVALGQVVFVSGTRVAQSTKAVAVGLGRWLTQAHFAAGPTSARLLTESVRHLDLAHLATYRGKVVVAVDPTEYAKRSRGRGKRGRHMQHAGRVRQPAKTRPRHTRRQDPPRAQSRKRAKRPPQVATTSGYVDVWAGLVLKGKQFLPLARQLFSSHHPCLTSQTRVEEAVLGQALALLKRAALVAIVVGDRGLGRKELLIRLATREQDFVLRIDPDITAFTRTAPDGQGLTALLAAQPWLGHLVWDRGQEGSLPCQARVVTATIRFSRSGRLDDVQAATLQFLELVPLQRPTAPLVLATTLPVATLADAIGIARVYGWRWAIETGFETMKAWGLGRFMVRSWTAIERLLWAVALAYALLVLALRDGTLTLLHEQATALLSRLSVRSRRLTAGKLAEALGLDYARHRRAWSHCWLP
jgi:hypothetical protein